MNLPVLDFTTIGELAIDAAKRVLPPDDVRNALVETAIDSEGHEAIRIVYVLTKGGFQRLNGDSALDLIARLQRELSSQQEWRIPTVYYIDEEGLRKQQASQDETDDE